MQLTETKLNRLILEVLNEFKSNDATASLVKVAPKAAQKAGINPKDFTIEIEKLFSNTKFVDGVYKKILEKRQSLKENDEYDTILGHDVPITLEGWNKLDHREKIVIICNLTAAAMTIGGAVAAEVAAIQHDMIELTMVAPFFGAMAGFLAANLFSQCMVAAVVLDEQVFNTVKYATKKAIEKDKKWN